MANTLLRVYEEFSAAQHAREALLSSGFPASSVHLTSRDDEAGPVSGNFTVGNAESDRNAYGDVYTSKFADVVQRGVYLLEVEPGNDEERARASDIMGRYSSNSTSSHGCNASHSFPRGRFSRPPVP